MTTAAEISSALRGKKSGNGYIAHCPAHDDKNPSFSISESGDTPLFRCHAGCSQDSVITALTRLGLFHAKSRGPVSKARPKKSESAPVANILRVPDAEVEACHKNLSESDRSYLKSERLLSDDVIDRYQLGSHEEGRITIPIEGESELFEDLRRYLRKDKRPTPDCPKVLHRKGHGKARIFPIDQLESQSLLLCEGEMDTLAVISCGINAITTTAGAAHWTEENSKALHGKEITILMDHDEPGRKGAELRAKALVKQKCLIKIAQWPGDRPEKHDITDEIKLFGLESLKQIIQSATEFKNNSGNSNDLICFADVKTETIHWLWFPYIPFGKLIMIEGDPGLGKSWTLLAIACHVSMGAGLPGVEPCEPGNVLLMSAEDGIADTIKPRLAGFAADHSRIFSPRVQFSFDEEGIKLLESLIQQTTPKAVIIDPLVSYMGGDIDMNRANETRELMSQLCVLAERYQCAFILLRHLTKSSTDKAIYRGTGSIDMTGACRSVILVGADSQDHDNRALIHIKCNLAKTGVSQGFKLEDGTFTWTGESELTAGAVLRAERSPESSNSSLEEAKEVISSALQSGERPQSEIEEIAKGHGISNGTLRRAKKELGVIPRRAPEPGGGRGNGKWCWRLPALPNPVGTPTNGIHNSQECPRPNASALFDIRPSYKPEDDDWF